MTTEQILKVLENELRCVQRASTNQCDRGCEKCDLVMDDAVIVKAYGSAIKAVETVHRIKELCQVPGLRGDGYEDEVCDAISEFLYDTGKEWD